jgi:hypothetical protein
MFAFRPETGNLLRDPLPDRSGTSIGHDQTQLPLTLSAPPFAHCLHPFGWWCHNFLWIPPHRTCNALQGSEQSKPTVRASSRYGDELKRLSAATLSRRGRAPGRLHGKSSPHEFDGFQPVAMTGGSAVHEAIGCSL